MPTTSRGFLLVLLASIACHGEEGKLRQQVAGQYVREFRYPPQPPRRAADPELRAPPRPTPPQPRRRYELTLRADGRWTSAYISEPPNRRWDTRDSGTYRITGRRMVLRALSPDADPLQMFWIGNGDTLHRMVVPTDTTGRPLDTAGSPWINQPSKDELDHGIYVVRVK